MSNCTDNTIAFPRPLYNPPGLTAIDYRIGSYDDFRRALLQNLPNETELSDASTSPTQQLWRPTGYGDLALQMMEWWAYLADILTFYNERVATQSYLRTADLPESVNRLVRLLGYRPRPGIGATGLLAAITNTPKPVTIPAGFAIQSKPAAGQQPQIFEVDAYTTLGATPTATPTSAQISGIVPVHPTATESPINGTTITLAGSISSMKKGDTILLLPKTPALAPNAFAIATILSTTPATDPNVGPITTIQLTWKTAVSALAGQTQLQLFRNSQNAQVWQYPAATGKVVRNVSAAGHGQIDLNSLVRTITTNSPVILQLAATTYVPLIVQNTSETLWYANPAGSDPSAAPTAPGSIAIPIPHTTVNVTTHIPIDTLARARESASLLTERMEPTTAEPEIDVVSKAKSIESEFLDLTSSAFVSVNTAMATNIGILDTQANRTNFVLMHSWSLVDDLLALPPSTIGGTDSPNVITLESTTRVPFPANTIGQPALIEDAIGTGATAAVETTTTASLPTPIPTLISPMQAYTNLLPVSRGKTVTNETLGSGNAALPNQNFTLQNAPVTYLQSADSRSGDNYSSTVRVWVNGLQWTEVQSFYNQPADAQIFVTKEDNTGKTHILFGDGESGARLPTGVSNIIASYRYGSGADSPDAGALTVLLKQQPGLRALRNPVPVGGGADPDAPTKLRQLAPKSVLTFNRAVSAEDFEAIAASAPGVTRAAAAFAFDPIEQRPRVTVWVGDDDGAVTAARNAIATSADPNRLPAVLPAKRIQIRLSLSLVIDPRRQPAEVLAAAQSALLDPDNGLLGLNNIAIGQSLYDSNIYATCLSVPGVTAVHGLVFTSAQPHILILIRRLPGATGCAEHRHNPGAGAYFFLPDDGQSLSISVEAA